MKHLRGALLALVVLGAACYVESFGDRQLLQAKAACPPGYGGPSCAACKAGTYSLGGNSNCLKCPPQALCLRMPTPCEQIPACDVETGKPTSMCFVKKPEGAACNPTMLGNQPVPADGVVAHVCRSGECQPVTLKGEGAILGPSSPAGCKAGHGGKDCKPCGAGTFSLGGSFENCKSCDSIPQPFCMSMPGVCDTNPSCDATTGRFTSMCWVAKPEGSSCSIPGASGSYVCMGRECVPAKVEAAAAAVALTPTAAKTSVRCPETPMCRMAKGPCDLPPSCDSSGRPTSRCWLPKPDGAPCSPEGAALSGPSLATSGTGFVCVKRQCVAAAQANLPRPEKTTPVKCPEAPLCRMARGPCDMAPPCTADGKPASNCWVSKPDGAACSLNGATGTCRNRVCQL